MAVSDAFSIKFCNERLRPAADAMAQAYYHAQAFAANWGQNPSLALYGSQCRDSATRVIDAFFAAYRCEKAWFLPSGPSTLIPNDTTQIFDNGPGTAQDSTRPPLTGAKVTNIVGRSQEFQNWLLSATGSFTDSARASVAWFNTVYLVSNYGYATLVQADAATYATRCSELQTNYTANSSANLGTILAVAVNPNA